MKSNALTVIHKVLRTDLFDLCSRLSCASPEDADAVQTALESVAQTLHGHAEREDQGLVPMLAERSPELADAMSRDHRRLEAQLDALREQARLLCEMALEERATALSSLYLDWNRFVSAYLSHLDDEERTLFQSFADSLPPVEAIAQGVAASGSDEAPAYLQRIARSLTPDERERIERAYAGLAL